MGHEPSRLSISNYAPNSLDSLQVRSSDQGKEQFRYNEGIIVSNILYTYVCIPGHCQNMLRRVYHGGFPSEHGRGQYVS